MIVEPQHDRDQDDLVQVLHQEIDRLPGSYRAAVVVCYLEGMTQSQAAQELRLAETTVRGRLARREGSSAIGSPDAGLPFLPAWRHLTVQLTRLTLLWPPRRLETSPVPLFSLENTVKRRMASSRRRRKASPRECSLPCGSIHSKRSRRC